jgi:hypothetical protein
LRQNRSFATSFGRARGAHFGNTRDRNFTQAKMQRRLAQIDESIARYLSQLDSADPSSEEPSAAVGATGEMGVGARYSYTSPVDVDHLKSWDRAPADASRSER